MNSVNGSGCYSGKSLSLLNSVFEIPVTGSMGMDITVKLK
jgi:hypothetical protein